MVLSMLKMNKKGKPALTFRNELCFMLSWDSCWIPTDYYKYNSHRTIETNFYSNEYTLVKFHKKEPKRIKINITL